MFKRHTHTHTYVYIYISSNDIYMSSSDTIFNINKIMCKLLIRISSYITHYSGHGVKVSINGIF